MDGSFPFAFGGDGIAPNLKPTPPAAMPEAPGPGDALRSLSPFAEPQDVDAIIAQLSLDRPLPLFIPDREKYTEYEFHIINDTPQEYAAAARRGWRVVDDPELTKLFSDKVSGTSKEGKMTRPVLMARHRKIGEAEAAQKRARLHETYKGLDPRNRAFNSKYVDPRDTVNAGLTKGLFSGQVFNIRK